MDEDLRSAVGAFAARPRVLVAVDFDGTLSPFVTDPLQARALPGGIEALRSAAALAGVTAAVVSGRDLATLAQLTGIGPGDDIALIGSHGAQTTLEPGEHLTLLDNDAETRLAALRAELEVIGLRYPAVRLEFKPTAVALHTRGVEPSVAAAATQAAHDMGVRSPGVHVLPGKHVVELTVFEANKGSALLDLALSSRSEATLYCGDDVTDEHAFVVLSPSSGDLTIKVGDGETVAAQRVSGPSAVVELLQLFVDERRRQT